MLQCIILALFLSFAYSSRERPLVHTSLGPIRGQHKLSYANRTFSAFEGIPYAKPPIGALRFKEPSPIEPWLGTWNATAIHECIQGNWFAPGTVLGSEDCLYLNVYVPHQPTSKTNLDVVVYIHGGAFMLGSGDLGGPDYLMDRDIVYVTFNYRLAALGFLSTEDKVVPGNNGLKDQTLALKWVQSHIRDFGGNPDSVTILGLSAGGASVHFHYFSPLSKGLFHRGIAQSGTALAPWAIQEAPLEFARRLSARVGCDHKSTFELIACLRQRSASEIVKNTYDFSPFPSAPIAPFAPVIEVKSDTAFLVDYPYNLLQSGNFNDLPLITSATTEEGILGLMTLKNNYDNLNNHWEEILPHILNYNYTVTEEDKPKVADQIKQFYYGDAVISEDNVQSTIQLFGDRYFTLNLEKSARMHAKVSKWPIYSYLYGYKNQLNFSSKFGMDDSYGVCHGEDGFLLHVVRFLGLALKVDKLSEPDQTIKELLVDVVTSFAKNGKPEAKGVDWQPVGKGEDFGYLFIRKPQDVGMVFKKEIAPTKFWKSLPIRENENMGTLHDEL